MLNQIWPEKAKHVDGVTSNAYENGGSSSTTVGFDSMKDNVMLALGDGKYVCFIWSYCFVVFCYSYCGIVYLVRVLQV